MKRIAIIENSEGLGAFFINYLEPGEYELFPVWKDPAFPAVEDFDAFIITGDYKNLSDGLLGHHRKEVELVRAVGDKKVFGSCFGHQLFGQAFGGKLGKREKRFFGWNKLTITARHPIFNGLDDPFFLSLNGDEVTVKPEGAKLLATNPDCENLIFQYGENIISCQPHPEIRKEDGLKGIEEHRGDLVDRCPDLDGLVEETKEFADDEASDRFLNNIMDWLRS